MLFAGTPQQAEAVLRAMRHVATAGDAHPLTDADRAALLAAHHIVFRAPSGDGFDPDALADITPDDLAATVTKREDAEHTAAFLTIMAIVDGEVDDARIRAAAHYAHALGRDEAYLHDLSEIARQKLDEARADMGRRNIKSFTGTWLREDVDTWILPYRDHPDPELYARYSELARYDDGTFGKTFADFYAVNGFDYPGKPDSANEEFITRHDSAHLVSGYDTSPQGELLVSAFTAGMHPDEPVTGHILPTIVSWHLGIEVAKFAGSYTGALDPRKFWVAWERGDETAGDTLSPRWDFWAHAERPLGDVQAEMRVPPLAPEDAADPKRPDSYTPTA